MISAFGVEHTIEKSMHEPVHRAATSVKLLTATKGGNRKLGYIKRKKNSAVIVGHKAAAHLVNPKSPFVTPNSPFRHL